jgi:hypothetical protein
MKKIILTICIVVTIISCSVQKPRSGNTSYKALKNFNKDTLAYLKYNFEEHADSYKGKPISAVAYDLEIKVFNYIPGFAYMNKQEQIPNLEIDLGVIEKQVVNINIELDQSLLLNDVKTMLTQSHKAYPDSTYTTSPIKRDFYKKLKIKDIKVYEYEYKKR